METEEIKGSAVVDRHIRSKKRLKLVRTGGPLALTVVIVIMLWSIVSLFTSLDKEEVTRNLQTEGERVWPKVQDKLTEAAGRLQPKIQEQFAEQQKTLAPEVEKRFDEEVSFLRNAVNDTFGKALNKGLEQARARQMEILVEEFPALKGDTKAQERVIASMQEGAQTWARGQFDRSLSGHITAMERIRDTLNQKFAGEGKGAQPEHMMLTWLELMADTVGGDESILQERGDKGAAKKGAKKGEKKIEGGAQ